MHSLRTTPQNPRVLLIDNYDSFTWNLAHYLAIAGANVDVVRNDELTAGALAELSFDGLVLSPGPGAPDSAGVTLEAIRRFSRRVPMLGVCLGHQAIGQAFGGTVLRSREIVHGKKSLVALRPSPIFEALPATIGVGRYHSLVVSRRGLPDELEVTGLSERGEIMALQHRALPVFGVQFHPESLLTEHGLAIVSSWVALCNRPSNGKRPRADAARARSNASKQRRAR